MWDFLAEDALRREIQSQLEDELEIMNYLVLSEILGDELPVDSPGSYSEDGSDSSNNND